MQVDRVRKRGKNWVNRGKRYSAVRSSAWNWSRLYEAFYRLLSTRLRLRPETVKLRHFIALTAAVSNATAIYP